MHVVISYFICLVIAVFILRVIALLCIVPICVRKNKKTSLSKIRVAFNNAYRRIFAVHISQDKHNICVP